jgi:hypothetical protein
MFGRGNRKVGWVRTTVMLLLVNKFPGEKRKRKTVHCHDATASSFVTKVWGEVFSHLHAVTVHCHSSMQN